MKFGPRYDVAELLLAAGFPMVACDHAMETGQSIV